MANQIVGQILSIGQPQSLTSKGGVAFTKRNLILAVRRFDPNTGEPFTDRENTPELSFMGERCKDLDMFQPGNIVVVSFDINGRKYTDNSGVEKIINDIRPYKIELYARQGTTTPAPQPKAQLQQGYQQAQQPYQPAPAQPNYGGQSNPQGGFQSPF